MSIVGNKDTSGIPAPQTMLLGFPYTYDWLFVIPVIVLNEWKPHHQLSKASSCRDLVTGRTHHHSEP